MSTFDDNLKKRMAETWDSELEPEMVTPNSAGAEDLPDFQETFPLTKQFHRSLNDTDAYSLNTNRKRK